MGVSAASLLTAVAVTSFFGGGSAAAPKPLVGVENIVASPAQVEYAGSQHINAPDGILRRGALPKRIFVPALVVALSTLAVVYLVVQCTRILSHSSSAPLGQQRLLAEGGADPPCGGRASGGQETTPATETSPGTLAGRVSLQKSLLQVMEEDRHVLSAEELLELVEAQKALQDTQDRVDVVHRRLVTVEQQITSFHQNVMVPGAIPSISTLAALGKLEERKAVMQKRYSQEQSLLSAMAYQPSQARRAFLKFAGAQASGKPVPEHVAEALAASERVRNPGKVFADVPSPAEGVALLRMADNLRQEMEKLADVIHGVAEVPKNMDPRTVREVAEARAFYAERFQRQLQSVGMSETSVAVQSSLTILKDVLMRSPPQASGPLLSALQESFAGLSLEESEKVKREMDDLKADEGVLLSTSKIAMRAASPTPTYDEGWTLMHRKFAELASTFIVSGGRTVSPHVPEDVRKAYIASVGMCQASLEKFAIKLGPFWKRKTKDLDANLLNSLMEMQHAEKNLSGVLPNGDEEMCPIIGVARECREKMIAAVKWADEIAPLAKAHPLVDKLVGEDLTQIRATVASADEGVVRALDEHAAKLAARAVDELGRALSVPVAQLPFTDGLRVQRLLQIAHEDIRQIHRIIVNAPPSVSFLEANLHALAKALDKHMNPFQPSSGSTKRRSTRSLRKGDSGGKK
ncbi:hypothetical protein Emag_004313 [Eimeria magna]